MNCSATVSNAALAARFEPLIPPAWQHIFTRLLWDSLHHCPAGESAATLLRFLHNQYLVAEEDPTLEIYPPYSELFRAFWEVPPDEVRVVLLGQDPYHGEGQAHGLCFSVPRGVKTPPSLRNIFKEREADVGIPSEGASPCLEAWARQGVLLLNTTLSVRAGAAGSHRKRGWEQFTDGILSTLDGLEKPIVFLLWGADARRKKALLHNPSHLIIESEHPSPLSAHRGFFGSRPFSRTNEFLRAHGAGEIDWATN
jgi:uracil-DNA glycosylase